MRILEVKAFCRWARKEGVSDDALKNAVSEIEKGLVETNLGSGVLKKRIPASSRGKRGRGRTIIAFKRKNHTFFMFGFSKSETDNISQSEFKALKNMRHSYFL